MKRKIQVFFVDSDVFRSKQIPDHKIQKNGYQGKYKVLNAVFQFYSIQGKRHDWWKNKPRDAVFLWKGGDISTNEPKDIIRTLALVQINPRRYKTPELSIYLIDGIDVIDGCQHSGWEEEKEQGYVAGMLSESDRLHDAIQDKCWSQVTCIDANMIECGKESIVQS